MYRVFGSPYNLTLHQSVSYLRHKRVPFKVHNGSLTTTKIMSMWHRAKMGFCTLSPQRETLLLIHQVLENCEAAAACQQYQQTVPADSVKPNHTAEEGLPPSEWVPMLVSAERYPKLNLAIWAIFLYGSSWLGSTGSLYRWVHGKGSSVVDDYVAYLSRATSIVPGIGTLVSPRIRNLMLGSLAEIGIVAEAEPYMIAHFHRFCTALDAHFAEINQGSEVASNYLLGTSHPTLADVAMAAAFDGYFLRDDPPAMDIMTKYPNLYCYLRLVSELATIDGVASPVAHLTPQQGEKVPGRDSYDHVFPTLLPLLDLATEIFPWQIAQCDALRQHAKKGLKAEKVTVVDVATELPLSLWRRRDVVSENNQTSKKVSAKLVLPKVKSAPYIMLVDRSIIPAHTRCQEVELAQVCALGAIGAYPLYCDSQGALHSSAGCSDNFLNERSKKQASQTLYSMANELISTDDKGVTKPMPSLPPVTSIDFDTHHVKSGAAERNEATSHLKAKARRASGYGNKQEYDVKRAAGLAADATPSQSVVDTEGELKVESDTLSKPSESVDYALARVAMLLGRMRIEDFELRSVHRNKGIEFAIFPTTRKS